MDNDCVLYRTSNILGKKWNLLIVLEMWKGNKIKRYSELKRSLGNITPKILSCRLKELENHGLVKRTVYSESIPIKIEYTLTRSGREFVNILLEMKRWALKHKGSSVLCLRTDCLVCKR